MINIQRYREMLLELRECVNKVSKTKIGGVVIAVSERHLVKKLRDVTGLMLCANYPDTVAKGDKDNYRERNGLVLFLLEKVSSGQETDEEELMHYARIQQVMQLLKTKLREMDFFCGEGEVDDTDSMTVEWEYDVFGGWNGMSIGLNLVDYD